MLLLPRLRSCVGSDELSRGVPFIILLELDGLHVLERVLVRIVMRSRACLLPASSLIVPVAHLIVLLCAI